MRNETNVEKDSFYLKYFIIVPVLLFALFLQASCNVEKTEEGKMPDVDIEVESGELPEYDVETPDIDIQTEEKTITVPDVDLEETQVEVPTVEVTLPDENNNENIEKKEEVADE